MNMEPTVLGPLGWSDPCMRWHK